MSSTGQRSNTYIVVGAPGMGKTPFVRALIEGRRCFVFDINNEYGQRTKYVGQTPVGLSDNHRDERSRYTGTDVKQFSEIVLTKRNTICVFEEATAFFQGAQDKLTRRILINRYHTENTYVFLFHSIAAIPPSIMTMCNIFVLLHTNDQDHYVLRKYPSIATQFLHHRESKKRGEATIIQLI